MDILMKDPDAPLPANVRIMKDSDMERLKYVQTSEELNDVHNHFILYYSQDLAPMHAAWKIKEKERKKREKREAR